MNNINIQVVKKRKFEPGCKKYFKIINLGSSFYQDGSHQHYCDGKGGGKI